MIFTRRKNLLPNRTRWIFATTIFIPIVGGLLALLMMFDFLFPKAIILVNILGLCLTLTALSVMRISLPSLVSISIDIPIKTHYRYIGFTILCLSLIIITLYVRALQAFTYPLPIDWDETYYASIAVTGSAGIGLYPHVQGYEQIPIMGGIGYFAYLYVFAYEILGPSIFSLRAVSFGASIIGLIGFAVLMYRWYGAVAAWVTLALVPSLHLFITSNTIRMDAITFAYLSWSLVCFSWAIEKRSKLLPHLLVGFIFGMGLQAHLHTFAIAFACGLLYLTEDLQNIRRNNAGFRHFFIGCTSMFVFGYALAFIIFVTFNILPYPDGFFRAAGLARLSKADGDWNFEVELNVIQLLASFINPLAWLRKELMRLFYVFLDTPVIEIVLWMLAYLRLLYVGKTVQDHRLVVLIIGTILGGSIIINADLAAYARHMTPILFVPLILLFTSGFRTTQRVIWPSIPIWTMLMLLGTGVMLPRLDLNQMRLTADRISSDNTTVLIPNNFHEVVSSECHIAGNAANYVPHLLEYPRFTSTRLTEVVIGRAYHDMNNEPYIEYWRLHEPDVILGSLVNGTRGYVIENNFVEISPYIWVKPGDISPSCHITVASDS